MKIKIELRLPKYCDGCPFLKDIEHLGEDGFQETRCTHYKIDLTKAGGYYNRVKRPKKCIKENGE